MIILFVIPTNDKINYTEVGPLEIWIFLIGEVKLLNICKFLKFANKSNLLDFHLFGRKSPINLTLRVNKLDLLFQVQYFFICGQYIIL